MGTLDIFSSCFREYIDSEKFLIKYSFDARTRARVHELFYLKYGTCRRVLNTYTLSIFCRKSQQPFVKVAHVILSLNTRYRSIDITTEQCPESVLRRDDPYVRNYTICISRYSRSKARLSFYSSVKQHELPHNKNF